MEQVIFGGSMDPIDDTDTEYNSLVGGWGWGASEFQARKVVSTSGKIKNLRVRCTAPGDGKSLTFTLMVNGVGSALTVTIADAATSGADTTHEVDVVAGDTISLECAPTNTPATGAAQWTSMFEGATAKESLILGGTGYIATLNRTATEYGQAMGAITDLSMAENDFRQVCPTSGKIKNLYVELSEDPGTSPDAYRFTLRKNGASQTLTVTITADDTTGHDTVNEITVAAGDTLTMMIEPLETPSASPYANWGMTFVADIDGESIVLSGTNTILLTQSAPIQCHDEDVWGLGGEWTDIGQSCTLKGLYMLVSPAPGGGNSCIFTVKIMGAGGNLTVTISDAATTGNDTVNTDAISDDDFVGLGYAITGAPLSAYAYWGVVGYIAPPAVGIENKSANMGSKMVAAGLI